jgi:flagellar motor switch protein FliM
VPLELELLTSSQLTWANAHAQVPTNSMAAIFEVEPIGTRMLLTAESNLMLGAIELLLGGSIEGGVKERRMTDIDQALGRHIFERLLGQLTLIWTDVAGLELKLDTVDQHLETAQMVSVSEPTLSLMVEARLQGTSAMLALLIPWSAIAPVADQFGARDDANGAQNEDDATSVRRAVGSVEMTVRAEVAAVELPIEAVLALKEGDLLRLNAPASGGITLFADKVPVHLGRPGRAGSRRAVQVTGKARGGR